MRGYTPIFELEVDGRPVAGAFYNLLVDATHVDNEGDEVDRLTIRLDDRLNRIELPRKGAVLVPRFGYRETGVVDKGVFKVENVGIEADVERGEFIIIEANAADLRKDAKGEGQKDHQGKSFGEIVSAEAKAMGMQAVVAPELASIPFVWRMRWNQSRLDFVTRLADEVGGIVKPAGGKLIVQKRGSGKSASGEDIPPLMISRGDCSAWRAKPEGRMQYSEVITYFTDPKTGQQRRGRAVTKRQGPSFTIREPFPNEAAARAAAEAKAGQLNRSASDVSFTLYGNPFAKAGQRLIASGFREGVDGSFTISTCTNEFKGGEGGGYTTEIDCKAPDEAKEGEGDD